MANSKIFLNKQFVNFQKFLPQYNIILHYYKSVNLKSWVLYINPPHFIMYSDLDAGVHNRQCVSLSVKYEIMKFMWKLSCKIHFVASWIKHSMSHRRYARFANGESLDHSLLVFILIKLCSELLDDKVLPVPTAQPLFFLLWSLLQLLGVRLVREHEIWKIVIF